MYNTYNKKHISKNIIGFVLSLIVIPTLIFTWIFHLGMQYIIMPKDKWLNPFNKFNWVIQDNYPNKFCYYFCNIESTLIFQLCALRKVFEEEYCELDKKIND